MPTSLRTADHPTVRRAPRRSHIVAITVALAISAGISSACVGQPYGNDGEKKPGEPNPARNGPPFDK